MRFAAEDEERRERRIPRGLRTESYIPSSGSQRSRKRWFRRGTEPETRELRRSHGASPAMVPSRESQPWTCTMGYSQWLPLSPSQVPAAETPPVHKVYHCMQCVYSIHGRPMRWHGWVNAQSIRYLTFPSTAEFPQSRRAALHQVNLGASFTYSKPCLCFCWGPLLR